jgi:hypothetical protein
LKAVRAVPAGLLLLLAATLAAEPRFLPDDPLRVDPDDLPFAKPQPIELSTAYDVLEHTYLHRPGDTLPPAANANTLGEVPDSSWFTNRGRLTPQELRRGPGDGKGPAEGDWTVIGAKTQGITPGFTIRDASGVVWFVKFDPPEYPHLSTSPDVVVSRFFHAFGYHVPENVLVRFRPERLKVAPDAKVTVKRSGGKKRPLTLSDVDGVLRRVPRLPDGRVLAVASRRLAGEPLGPFKYHGTRGDDPNDVIPHEHRRELRGLRVFAAWLNHDDSRSLNSQDMFVPGPDGRGHVRHHLIDFSSTLGAGSDAERRIAPQALRPGNEYVIEAGPMARSAFTLGIWDRPWRNVEYRVFPEVGRIESDFFRPERWKPEYPNPAFERMRPADAFWAAKIVARFDDEAVRTLVAMGEYGDAEAERHLVDTLRVRRDKTVAHWMRQLSPLDEFAVAGGVLRFAHLGERHGLGRVEGYDAEWAAFDNERGTRTPLGAPVATGVPELPLPAADAAILVVRLRARSSEPGWRKWVDVFVAGAGTPAVVGVDREE